MNVHRIAVLAALALVVAGVGAGAGHARTGIPVAVCGQVVTQDAYLTYDLYCPGSHGIVAGASGITIDLDGHTVRGDGSAGHAGVANTDGFDRVTITNGTVRGFFYGVDAYTGADEISIEEVVASANVSDGIAITGASAVIRKTTAAGNGGAGMDIYGDSAEIRSSTASANSDFGIVVYGPAAKIQSTTVVGNGDHGIWVLGEEPRIRKNRAEANGFATADLSGYGIFAASAGTGSNDARGNDDLAECYPASIC